MRLKEPNMWERIIDGSEEKSGSHACFCVGPQNGETECPCAIRNRRTNDQYLKGYMDGLKAAKKEKTDGR